MHPFIIQSISAEHARDLQSTVKHNRDASLARNRRLRLRLRRAVPTPGAVRLMPAVLRLHAS